MTELAIEYAQGLFELCADEHLTQQMDGECAQTAQVLKDNPDFIRLLTARTVSKEERLSILDETFASQVHPYLLNFMKLLLERGALNEFSDCVKVYHSCYLKAENITEAKVTSASELDEAQTKALIEKLEKLSGKKVQLKLKIDKSVIGGLCVEMDGKKYDNTVAHRLNTMKRALTEA